MSSSDDQQSAVAAMYDALGAMDAEAVEYAVIMAWQVGLHECMTPVLNALSEAEFHTRHEDVVRALQVVGNVSSVGALERVAHAKHECLSYDEVFVLARKCTWALADIGTSEARAALERLSQSSEPLIGEFAQKRLVNWGAELGRKRGK